MSAGRRHRGHTCLAHAHSAAAVRAYLDDLPYAVCVLCVLERLGQRVAVVQLQLPEVVAC